MTEYKCPYCGQDSYSKSSKKFTDWKAVTGHTRSCKLMTSQYFIDKIEGPIYYTEFLNRDIEIWKKYPNLQSALFDIRKSFSKRNIVIPTLKTNWNKESIILAIQQFYEVNNKVPRSRDFTNNIQYPSKTTVKRYFSTWDNAIKKAGFLTFDETTVYSKEKILLKIKEFYNLNKRIPQINDFRNNIEYPSPTTVCKYFGSWNNAIQTAGFIPNLDDGFGTRIIALDGVLYRSWYETEFVNKWLFNKEKYFYEVKYPNDNKFYDFYLPEKDLYIEIDGGLRPQVIEEKIAINKQLGRKLLVIKTSEIESFKGFI